MLLGEAKGFNKDNGNVCTGRGGVSFALAIPRGREVSEMDGEKTNSYYIVHFVYPE